ncbi:regulator of nucleoside diphosphate kinase [Aquipluma nitroreducens]|uniref:Regulator of nucleoside diphosphate kinase n=1 Tax=Aquipluma nitroreducens TaxID=2010828 RepID=A0A5K7S4M8_9BACT|nr:GreA/GreB family elongation factor [Aquipluma nitroreducens]BBE16503.1 regulator of nucleoside diphosphate kinase [Aquipluma nitroreducens]
MKRNIIITDYDYVRLGNLIGSIKKAKNEELSNLTILCEEIARAERVNPKEIEPDFVTMNSQVEVIDLDNGKVMTIKLVYPKDADFRKGNISILSLLGSALLGYRVGSIIKFDAPLGEKRIRIKSIIYQPEANGVFDV